MSGIAKDSTARAAAGWRAPEVICEDTFNNGLCGWTQLLEGVHGTGMVTLDSEITYGESRFSVGLMTADMAFGVDRPWGNASIIKRMSRGPTAGRVLAHWKFAYGSLRATNTTTHPRNIDFGIDQADADGTRQFFKLRWKNYDETVPGIVSKMQLHVDGGTPYVDIPVSPGVVLGVNENKRNLFDVELEIDADAGTYLGARVNGKGWGSLADVPDDSLTAYGPPPHALPQFASGFNFTMELCNRIDTNDAQCWANLAYFKAVQK